MTLHPIIQTIKRAAPEWAEWLMIQPDGTGYWFGGNDDAARSEIIRGDFGADAFRVITLSNGCVTYRDDGPWNVVSQDERSAEGDE